MRPLLRFAAVVMLVLAAWAPPRLAQAANQDTTADRVFGQPTFLTFDSNHNGLNANGLKQAYGTALDAQGNLYVADAFNNRVLEYNAPLSGDHTADRVFGQASFSTNLSNTDGLNVSASGLFTPVGVALDGQGNLFVADAFNNRVLEYFAPLTSGMAAGRVFGQPDFGSNGAGVGDASLNEPTGVTLDGQGNLYVADAKNNRVLEYDAPLSSSMAASRVLGQTNFNTNDINHGGINASSLYQPFSVALDGQSNLFVADTYNNRVLEYNAPLTSDHAADRVFGQPSFFTNTANTSGINASGLFIPSSVALDAQGNLYVADNNNNRVLEYDGPLSSGMAAHLVFGQPNVFANTVNNCGNGADCLAGPVGLTLDGQGNLFLADSANSRVLEYDTPMPYAAPTLAALSPSSVAAGSPAFTLTVDGTGFVPGSIVRWNGSNRPTTFLNNTQLNASISAGDVAGGGPFAVTVFTPAPGGGTSSLINLTLYARAGHDTTADVEQGQPNFGLNTSGNPLLPDANRLNTPAAVAVDARSGRLFVADPVHERVLSWPNAPAFANAQPADLVLGQPNFASGAPNFGGVSATSLSFPSGVALDAQGNLYVADYSNNRVLEYNAPLSRGMLASRVFGQGGSFTTALPNNGTISANSLSGPAAVALDAPGNLYVADYSNNRVLEYDAPLTTDATADRVFGQPNFFSSTANYNGVSASGLSHPVGVGLDGQGNLYVADGMNNRVLEYDHPLSSGMAASRVFGQPDASQNGPNNPSLGPASLHTPQGLAVDGRGSLYVADFNNNRVLEYDQPLTSNRSANRVFGQLDFIHNLPNIGGAVSGSSLASPSGVAVDAQLNLYVADNGNSRVPEYDWALVKDFLPLVRR